MTSYTISSLRLLLTGTSNTTLPNPLNPLSAMTDKIFVLYNGSLMTLEQYKQMKAEEQ